MIRITDDLGTGFEFDGPPQRIVSLVPSLTETLIKMGAAERVVGCTEWCIHPADITADIPKVGGTKNVSIQKVLALEPNLVIANKEENRERHIEALREEIPVFVTYPRTVDDGLETLGDMGVIAGNAAKAEEIARTCRSTLAQMAARDLMPLVTACLIWRDPWMAVGPGTYVNDLLNRCGFANAFGESPDRYPQTTLEEVFDRDVEVILLPDEPFEFGSKDVVDVMKARPTDSSAREIVLLDGSYLTWYGVRIAPAVEFLGKLRGGM